MSHRHFRWLLALVIACACSTPADRFVDPNNAPVYLYCDHGRDRTGYIVARYRLRLQGWTGDQIERELDRYGHGRLMRWYMPALTQQLRRDANRRSGDSHQAVSPD